MLYKVRSFHPCFSRAHVNTSLPKASLIILCNTALQLSMNIAVRNEVLNVEGYPANI